MILIIISLLIFQISKAELYSGRFNNYLNHSCVRDCSLSPSPRVCEYEWTLEMYSTLSRACFNCPNNYTDCLRENCVLADGILKTIEVVNRLLPGPSVQVCKGDKVIVNLKNNLRTERVTSIHWHGLNQKHFPHMDGVGGITQCPIIPHTSFQYDFIASQAGTFYWHAHSGVQRSNGVYGAFIVRENRKEDVLANLYDYDLKEHYMILIEWTINLFQTDYGTYTNAADFTKQHTILINGKGQLTDKPTLNVPLETFTVKKGFRYRFRLINNAIEHCMMQISVDGHNLTVISADAEPIEPIEVESIASITGERYDFVINANKEEKDYWIKVRGEGDCNTKKLSQRAILRYERNEVNNFLNSTIPFYFEDSYREGLQLRPVDHAVDNQTFIRIEKARYPDNLNKDYFERISQQPNKKIYLNMDLRPFNDPEFHQPDLYPYNKSVNTWSSSVIDEIKFEMPPMPLMFNFENGFPKEKLCNKTSRNHICPEKGFCSCVHYLEFELNDLVELVLIDGGSLPETHSTHLHGYKFAVLGMDKIQKPANTTIKYLTTEYVEQLDKQNLLKRNFNRPPLKDTISPPTYGYAIIRFIADNPGFWMLHCHLDSHSDTGMMIVIKVGQEKDLPPKPNNWPSCGYQKTTPILFNNSLKIKFNQIYFLLALFFNFLVL